MLYVLYQTVDTNEQRYEVVNEHYTAEYESQWRASHPQNILIAIVNTADDLTAKFHEERIKFNMYCGNYGFRPDDYRATIKLSSGIGELIGFNPRNRKYPCLIQPMKPGAARIKATVDYVKQMHATNI